MIGCEFKGIPVLILLLLRNVFSAPVSITNPDLYTINENNKSETTTNTIFSSTAPMTDLIQLQTDAIKKILSTSIQSHNDDLTNPKSKCEDIESGIKESIRKSNAQDEIIIKNVQKEETIETNTDEPEVGDKFKEEITVNSDKNSIPNGRTLFSLYKTDSIKANENITPIPSTLFPYNQNIIVVPCVKRVTQNNTTQVYEEINHGSHNEQPLQNGLSKNYQAQENEQLIHSIDNNHEYVLERVYTPNGYLLYYMYRPRNLSPEQSTIESISDSTTTPSTTTTTTATPSLDQMYKEQLKFVIHMPYAKPEQILPYGYKFDQYAYYPSDLQPTYVNGPLPYSPTFHMIRTLIIPNEYNYQNNAEYKVSTQQSHEITQ